MKTMAIRRVVYRMIVQRMKIYRMKVYRMKVYRVEIQRMVDIAATITMASRATRKATAVAVTTIMANVISVTRH